MTADRMSPEAQAYHHEILAARRAQEPTWEEAIRRARKPNPLTGAVLMGIIGVCVIAGVMLAVAADAHVPTVTADCRVLEVTLTDYEPGTKVSVTIDDGIPLSVTFTGDWHYSTPWKADRSHVFKIVVDNKGDGVHDQWDQTWTGTTTPCVPPTTSTTTIPVVPLVQIPPTIPVVNPPAVLEREPTVTEVAHTEPVLAFTGPGRVTLEIALGFTLIAAAGVCLALSNRAANRKAVTTQP